MAKPAYSKRITASTTQWGRSHQRPVQPVLTKTVTAPLSAHYPREFSPDCFSVSLVLTEDLIRHVVGHGGQGLKQVSDLSDARISVFSQEINGCLEHLVSIRGTNKQLGDALVVLWKWIVWKRVSALRKKKQGTSASGPVITGPSLLPFMVARPPSSATFLSSTIPLPRQTTTPIWGQVWQSQPQRQAFLLPPTPASRTVAMGSPTRPTSRNHTLTVPSVCMVSPEPTSSKDDLMLMEVDHILALVRSDNSGLPLLQRHWWGSKGIDHRQRWKQMRI